MIVINDCKILYPFLTRQWDINFLSAVTKLNKKNKVINPWMKYKLTPLEIRQELKELNIQDSVREAFSSFRLDKNYYSLYSIENDSMYLLPHNQLKKIKFAIKDICIHTFTTGITFLEINYSINSCNETDVLNLNYFLSELKADIEIEIIKSVWNKNTKHKEEIIEKIKVLDYIKRILSDYDKIKDIGMNSKLENYSTKPMLFSYYLLDNSNSNTEYHLGLNLKESYKVNNTSAFKSKRFENSTWYYSLNSTINVSYLINDPFTDIFFKTTFLDKLSNLYFFLFLNACHQKYFLQLCHYKTKIYNISLSTLDENKNLVDELSNYTANFNKAWLRYFFDAPTSIDHVNLFYSNVRESFNILKHAEIVTDDIAKLTEYASQKYKLFNEYNKLMSDKKKSQFDLITFLVASIISFVSIYDVFLKMIENFDVHFSLTIHIILAIVFMTICFIVPTVINFYFNMKRIKKINIEISHLKSLICEQQNLKLF